MALVHLVLALAVFAGVVALGVWGMVRADGRFSGSPDSVLAQWAAAGQGRPRHR